MGDNPDRDATCTGVMRVHYGLLQAVVERAARQLCRQTCAATQDGRSGHGRGLQRRCHDRIVAIQVRAARLDQTPGAD